MGEWTRWGKSAIHVYGMFLFYIKGRFGFAQNCSVMFTFFSKNGIIDIRRWGSDLFLMYFILWIVLFVMYHCSCLKGCLYIEFFILLLSYFLIYMVLICILFQCIYLNYFLILDIFFFLSIVSVCEVSMCSVWTLA